MWENGVFRKLLNSTIHPKSKQCPECGGVDWYTRPALGLSEYIKCVNCEAQYYRTGATGGMVRSYDENFKCR